MADLHSSIDPFIADLPFLFWIARGEKLKISHWSQMTARTLGYDDFPANLTVAAILDDTTTAQAAHWLQNSMRDVPPRYSGQLRCRDGRLLAASVHPGRMDFAGEKVLTFFAVCTPASPALRSERISTVAEHSRSDALRMIADGMGHEVNNPLQAIFGYAELAMVLNKDPELSPHLQEIMRAAERVKAAITSLKNFTTPNTGNQD